MDLNPYLHADEVDDSAEAARHVVPVVLDAVGPVRSLADLGGGTGAWAAEFKRRGVGDVRVYDLQTAGADLLVDPSEFEPVDLQRSFPPPPRVDLAVCVEVAEHLTADRAAPLVDWLTSAADVVVFSAAVTGQTGNGHVNEQPPWYWTALFADRGFVRRDVLRGPLMANEAVPFWYRLNLVVYVRTGVAVASTAPDFMPEGFMALQEWNTLLQPAPPVGLGAWARLFWPALRATLRNRVR